MNNINKLIELMERETKEAISNGNHESCYDDEGNYYDIGYAAGMEEMMEIVKKFLTVKNE